eukprot:scaffold437_cov159-Amphora_coffeaeformis.AAC.6
MGGYTLPNRRTKDELSYLWYDTKQTTIPYLRTTTVARKLAKTGWVVRYWQREREREVSKTWRLRHQITDIP